MMQNKVPPHSDCPEDRPLTDQGEDGGRSLEEQEFDQDGANGEHSYQEDNGQEVHETSWGEDAASAIQTPRTHFSKVLKTRWQHGILEGPQDSSTNPREKVAPLASARKVLSEVKEIPMLDWTLGRAFRVGEEIHCAQCFEVEEVNHLAEEDVLLVLSTDQPVTCSVCGEQVTCESCDAYDVIVSWREDHGATRKVG
jgi:hypothetical protein